VIVSKAAIVLGNWLEELRLPILSEIKHALAENIYGSFAVSSQFFSCSVVASGVDSEQSPE
jgi:hypothetical protein